MKKESVSFTGQALLNFFKEDVVCVKNKYPIPKDAKLKSIYTNFPTDEIVIEYTSKEAPMHAEGAVTSLKRLELIMKKIFRIGKKKVRQYDRKN